MIPVLHGSPGDMGSVMMLVGFVLGLLGPALYKVAEKTIWRG